MYICRVRLNPALLHTGKNSPAPCHLVPACNATAAPLVMQLECAHPRCTCTASPHAPAWPARMHAFTGNACAHNCQSVGLRVPTCAMVRWMARCVRQMCVFDVRAHMCAVRCSCPVFVPDVRVRCAMARCSCPMFVPTCAMARCSYLVFVPGVRGQVRFFSFRQPSVF